jgi:ankyrin repeat protein
MRDRHLIIWLLLMFTVLAFAQSPGDELIAAAKRGDAEAVKTMIARGADANARTNYGATALHFAADRGHLEVVKILVGAGADVMARDTFYKFTPMQMAMMRQHKEVISYLQQVALEKQGSPKPVTPANIEPVPSPAPQSAAKAPEPALNEELLSAAKKGDLAAVKSLLPKGASVNAKTRYDQTPLMFASEKGHLEIVKVLLEAGADVNVVDTFYKSFTALSAAARNGHAEIVKLLLEKGARSKDQALFAGVQSGHAAVVKAALDLGGINPESLNRALDFASEGENKEIVEMLKQAGAVASGQKPLKPEVAVDEATLRKYAGTYRLDDARQFTFIVRNGKLGGWDVRQYSFQLTAIDRNVFRIGNSDDRTVTFNEEGGRVDSITVAQSGFKQTYNRVEGK